MVRDADFAVDSYIEKVIERGDEGSELLAKRAAPTLRNSKYVRVISGGMHGMAVLRVPEDCCVVVHSASGKREEEDVENHATSLVYKLLRQADHINVEPVAFADVIDSSTGETDMLNRVMDGLVGRANRHMLAILNGENAILGERITREANVSGTMVSLGPRDLLQGQDTRVFTYNGVRYAVFDHHDLAVFMNSDGNGTKTEILERMGRGYELALRDSLAMKLDDLIKKGAIAKVVSDAVEISGDIPFHLLEEAASRFLQDSGIAHILQREDVGDRLRSYKSGVPAYNISGSAVSVIDEEMLRNPPKPREGESLVAIAGVPNPRANGITAKRKIMVDRFGLEWHTTEEGKPFLDYLSRPSTILYFVFRDLLEKGLATSFYHMSGGAYDGKLAKPLAKEGLFARVEGLFEPDPREVFFVEASGSLRNAYAKFPMGNDGFVTTSNPREAIRVIEQHGYRARDVGKLEKMQGKTSLTLVAYNGKEVNFPE